MDSSIDAGVADVVRDLVERRVLQHDARYCRIRQRHQICGPAIEPGEEATFKPDR
jgi:hypothetical protein